MPGIKRKASQTSRLERPPKLKKQSTSTNITSAKGSLKKAKSTALPKLQKISSSPKKAGTPKKTPEKPLPLPRFPTLKPTGPFSNDPDVDFVFSVPKFYSKSPSSSAKYTSLKKAPTVLVKEASSSGSNSDLLKKISSKKTSLKSNKTLEITPEPNTVPPVLDLEIDSDSTRASDIEKRIQKLPSGSFVGKITNLEFDDLILPSDASLALYESSGVSLPSYSGSPESRKSAYVVAEFFSLTEPKTSSDSSNVKSTEQTTTSSTNGIATQTDLDMPPLCLGESSNADPIGTVSNPVSASVASGTPSKSPRKVPGGLREIVFSFDTTGSMYNYMEEAGEKIRELVTRLQEDIPGIRLAFVAHGDYYDLKHDRYLIKWIDFGASIDEIAKFFDNLAITHGGDADECYELVLHKVRESFSWTAGSQRSLVIIGDSDPHEPGYKFEEFVNDIDWRVEAALLRDMGVRIYGLQVGYQSDFYRQICQITSGAHLRIDNASFTYDTLMSICLREGSLKLLKSYENEVRKAKKNSQEGGILDLELERLFSALKSVEDNKSSKAKIKFILQSEKEEKKEKKLSESKKDGKHTGKRASDSDNSEFPSPPKLTKVDSHPPEKGNVSARKTAPKLTKSPQGTKATTTKSPLKKTLMPKKPALNRKTSLVQKKKEPKTNNSKLSKLAVGKASKKSVSLKLSDNKTQKSPGRPKLVKTESKGSKKTAEKSEKSKKVVKATSPGSKRSDGKPNRGPGRPKVYKGSELPASGKSEEKSKKSPGRPKAVKRTASPSSKRSDEIIKKRPGRPKMETESASGAKMSDRKLKKSPGKPKVLNKKGPGRPKKGEKSKSPGAKKSEEKSRKAPGRPKVVKRISTSGTKRSSEVVKKAPGRPKVMKKLPGRPKSVIQVGKKAMTKQTSKLAESKVTSNKSKATQSKKLTAKGSSSREKKTANTKLKGKPVKKVISTKIGRAKKVTPVKKQKPVSGSTKQKAAFKNKTSVKKVVMKKNTSGKVANPRDKQVPKVKESNKVQRKNVSLKRTIAEKKIVKQKVNSTSKNKNDIKKVQGKVTGRTTAGKISKVKKLSKTVSKVKTQVIKKTVKSKTPPPKTKGKMSLKSEKNKKEATKKNLVSKTPSEQKLTSKKSPVNESSKGKTTKSIVKSPAKSTTKQLREKATVTKFVMGPLSSFSWDNWSLLISPIKPNIRSDEWKKNRSWCSAFCNNELYKESQKIPAIYEIAVNPPSSSKKYPVFFSTKALWDCFSSSHVQMEVNRVLKLKGSICVRRGTLPKHNNAVLEKAAIYIRDNFDYAWEGKGRKESVNVDNFVIAKA